LYSAEGGSHRYYWLDGKDKRTCFKWGKEVGNGSFEGPDEEGRASRLKEKKNESYSI